MLLTGGQQHGQTKRARYKEIREESVPGRTTRSRRVLRREHAQTHSLRDEKQGGLFCFRRMNRDQVRNSGRPECQEPYRIHKQMDFLMSKRENYWRVLSKRVIILT